MIVANKELLDKFVQSHANAVKPMNKWLNAVEAVQWKSHVELKEMFPSAKMVVMFSISVVITSE